MIAAGASQAQDPASRCCAAGFALDAADGHPILRALAAALRVRGGMPGAPSRGWRDSEQLPTLWPATLPS